MAISHENAAHIHKFAHVQATDPGAVGAKKGWVDTSNPTYVLKVRNDANSGWINVGVLGSSIVGTVANASALLQRTRVQVEVGQPSTTVLIVPAGRNAIIERIVLTAITDATAINTDEVSFVSGAQNLTGQIYDRASIFFGDLAKGQGLGGPGFAGSLQGRYDPDTGFIYDFGIIDADLVMSHTYAGFVPYEVDVFVFGTMIDDIV